jgi:broad specificity phosphatase PhoE
MGATIGWLAKVTLRLGMKHRPSGSLIRCRGWRIPPTGGETSVEISSRASLVIAEIQEKYATGDVLVVSHKATIRIILCSLLGH